MLTKTTYALMVLAIILAMCSCGHYIHDGRVVEKSYQPGEYYTYYTPIPCGKSTIIMPHTGYDDPDWVITVTNVFEGDTLSEEFYLDSAQWHCMDIGAYFNDTIICTKQDDRKK